MTPSYLCLPGGFGRAACAIALLSSAIFPISASHADTRTPGRVEFEVFRNGEPFGKHSVTVSNAGGVLVAESAADLKVNLGPLTVFRYKQTCRETWKQALAGLSCATLKDGRTTKVEGAPEGQAFKVSAGRASAGYPVDVLPSAWWSKPPIGSYEMINTETGKKMPVNVTSVGRETIKVGGASVEAEHIRVSGTLTVDLWYDDAGRWVSCAFSIGGQNMTYRLLTPVSAAPT